MRAEVIGATRRLSAVLQEQRIVLLLFVRESRAPSAEQPSEAEARA